MSNETEVNTDWFIGYIKAPCYQLNILGAMCVIFFAAGLPVNATLIWTIFKHKSLRTPINNLVVCLALNNLLGTLADFPLLAANSFSCKFLFSNQFCVFMAFVFMFCFITANFLLTLISIERYLVICKPFKMNIRLKSKRLIIGVIFCVFMGSFWPLTPLLGWSNYMSDGVGISCTVDPAQTLAYGFALILIVYVSPILIMIFTNVAIIRTVKKSAKKLADNSNAMRNLKKERHLFKVTAVLIATFLGSNLPSVILEVIGILDANNLKYLFVYVTGSLIIARSSFVWTSLLYMLMNKDIKAKLLFLKSNKQIVPITVRTKPKNLNIEATSN